MRHHMPSTFPALTSRSRLTTNSRARLRTCFCSLQQRVHHALHQHVHHVHLHLQKDDRQRRCMLIHLAAAKTTGVEWKDLCSLPARSSSQRCPRTELQQHRPVLALPAATRLHDVDPRLRLVQHVVTQLAPAESQRGQLKSRVSCLPPTT